MSKGGTAVIIVFVSLLKRGLLWKEITEYPFQVTVTLVDETRINYTNNYQYGIE